MSANVAVIVGILLSTYTTFLRADALVGIGIALWLFYTAYKVARLAWNQLMDQELPDRERELVRELALQDKRIHKIHNLRTRASGPHVHIQMQVDLDDGLTLNEAHDIIVAAESRMMEAYPAADILIRYFSSDKFPQTQIKYKIILHDKLAQCTCEGRTDVL